MTRKVTTSLVIATCVFLAAVTSEYSVAQERSERAQFDGEGHLIKPKDYRTWVHLGTIVTPDEQNNGRAPMPGFHSTYIHTDHYAAFVKSGAFSDGTIIVQEYIGIGTETSPAGSGYFMGEPYGLDAAVKDAKRFPNAPGNWGYFSFGRQLPLAMAAEVFPAAACANCHQANAATDNVFTQYYPTLKAAHAESSAQGEPVHRPSNPDIRETLARFPRHGSLPPTQGVELGIGDVPPPDGDKWFVYLQADVYKSFPHTENVRPSAGPHADIRVFMNPVLSQSMASGAKTHPAGAAAIVEEFRDGKPAGWAVMLKAQAESAQGDGWYWYEVLSDTDAKRVLADGPGVKYCVDCHKAGKDFVRSTTTPK